MESQFQRHMSRSIVELDGNEAVVSLALVTLSTRPEDGQILAVGTTQGLSFNPRQVEGTVNPASDPLSKHLVKHCL